MEKKKQLPSLSTQSGLLNKLQPKETETVFNALKNKYLKTIQSTKRLSRAVDLTSSMKAQPIAQEFSRDTSQALDKFQSARLGQKSLSSACIPLGEQHSQEKNRERGTSSTPKQEARIIKKHSLDPLKIHLPGKRQTQVLKDWLEHMLATRVHTETDLVMKTKQTEAILNECIKELAAQVSYHCREMGDLLSYVWGLASAQKNASGSYTSRQNLKVQRKDLVIASLNQKVKKLEALIHDQADEITRLHEKSLLAKQQQSQLQALFDNLSLSSSAQQLPPTMPQVSPEQKETRTVVASTSDLEVVEDELQSMFQFKVVKRPPKPYTPVRILGYFDDKGCLHRTEMTVKRSVAQYPGDIVPLSGLSTQHTQTDTEGAFVCTEDLRYMKERLIGLDSLDDVQVVARFVEDLEWEPESQRLVLETFSWKICEEDVMIEDVLESDELPLNSTDSSPSKVFVDASVQTLELFEESKLTRQFSVQKATNKRASRRATQLLSGLVQRFIEQEPEGNSSNKFLMRLIPSMYSEKQTLNKDNNWTVPLSTVLYNNYLNRFGLKAVAEKKYKKTIKELMLMKQSKRVENFLKFLGLLDKYEIDELNLYLTLYELNLGKGALVNEEGGGSYLVPFQKAAVSFRSLFEDKLTRVEWDTAKEEFERLKVGIVQGLRHVDAVDIDLLGELLIKHYRILKESVLEYLRTLHPGITQQTLLSFEDFAHLLCQLPQTLSEDEATSLFQAYSETSQRQSVLRTAFFLKEAIDRSLITRTTLDLSM